MFPDCATPQCNLGPLIVHGHLQQQRPLTLPVLAPSPNSYKIKPKEEVENDERRFGKRRSSFTGVGRKFGITNGTEGGDGTKTINSSLLSTRRKSWGELFGILGKKNNSNAADHIQEPQQRKLIEPPSPMLGDIRKLEQEKDKKGRGFRKSFGDSVKNLLGVQEFGVQKMGIGESDEYPEKIVRRLKAEAIRLESAAELSAFPPCLLSLKPNKVKNTHNVFVHWQAEIMGPSGTVWERTRIELELFVGPDYPFKGPTIQYEGHIAEFVVGKNQTDPREKNILCPWTPAMNLLDSCVAIEKLLGDQHKKLVYEQTVMEADRVRKLTNRIKEEEGSAAAAAAAAAGSVAKVINAKQITELTTAATIRVKRKSFQSSPTTDHLNPLRIQAEKKEIDCFQDQLVTVADYVEEEEEEGEKEKEKEEEQGGGIRERPSSETQIVTLSARSALPRRGSFRGSIEGKNDEGDVYLDLQQLKKINKN